METTFLEAAYKVLSDAGFPMSAREITDRALSLELISSNGKTPSQTMKSKLSTEILQHKGRSQFMRTEAGKFGLRSWQLKGTSEYIADRYVKALMDEDAMVFPATSLRRYAPRPGLWPLSLEQSEELIRECRPLKRSEAEEDVEVIQVVSGFIVQHEDRVLTYKRTRRLPEARLHGEFSVIFGGHLNPDDFSPLFNIFDERNAGLLGRELNEELRISSSYEMRMRGILYDDTRPVSRQHIAVVFDVSLQEPHYTVGERGFLQQDKFETWDQVGSRLQDFENWSQLLYGIYSR